MPTTQQSPRSTLRRSIRETYRARHHGNSNLWLVYSVKTDRDWLLPSDRQLIHWLYFLESNPEVTTFDLAPEPIISADDKETKASEFDAIVVYNDGHIECHEVKAGDKLNCDDRSQLLAQANAASQNNLKYSIFNDQDLRPVARIAMRWIKPLGFAEVLRGQEHGPCRSALSAYFRQHQIGTVHTLLTQHSQFDPSIAIGIMIRLAVSGIVRFDLTRRSFGLQTSWIAKG